MASDEPTYEDNYAQNYDASPSKKKKQVQSPFTDILGPTLVSKSGDVPTASALADKKAVGLYFSAHWCPPCRGFTPELGKSYTKYLKAKGCEIVFLSDDHSESDFKSYYAEQADWLALPYSARAIKAKLSKKFKVSGIPTFVLLDGATGELITTEARDSVMQDPQGKSFPWKPKTFFEALGTEFLSGEDGDTVSLEEVQETAKVIGLYFSASWCGPCVAFTPELVKAYKEHLHEGKGLEVIFCSADRDASSFQSYYKKQPWLAIPNGDARVKDLMKVFDVGGYPTLVLVDAQTGELITSKARMNVMADPKGEAFPWPPKAAVDADNEGPDGVNETPSVCLLLDECDSATRATAIETLEQVAEAHKSAAKASGAEACIFFYGTERKGGFTEQVRNLCKLKGEKGVPTAIVLDIPEGGAFYVSSTSGKEAASKAGLEKLLADYAANKLPRKQLGR